MNACRYKPSWSDLASFVRPLLLDFRPIETTSDGNKQGIIQISTGIIFRSENNGSGSGGRRRIFYTNTRTLLPSVSTITINGSPWPLLDGTIRGYQRPFTLKHYVADNIHIIMYANVMNPSVSGIGSVERKQKGIFVAFPLLFLAR